MFKNRTDAGVRLAEQLDRLAGLDPVIVGISRGGVPVAAAVAERLSAPLEIAIVRKLGVPHHREVGFGAIGEDGTLVLDEDVVRAATVTEVERAVTERHERVLMQGQVRLFRAGRDRLDMRGRAVIVVDDGMAMGTSARVGCEMVRAAGASTVVVAVPVATAEALDQFADLVEESIALLTPTDLGSVGGYYQDFSQISDATVVDLLDEALQRNAEQGPPTI